MKARMRKSLFAANANICFFTLVFMEILIIGIIIVALMAFLSTRIKRNAAQAFEAEIVEKDEFRITKPEGLMSPLDENSVYLFEARSREYGEEKISRGVRQAHAFLTVHPGLNFKAECKKAKQSVKKILSEKVLNEADGEKVYLLEGEKIEKEAPMIEFRKIIESKKQKKTYNLQISVLQPYRETHIHRINEMTNSFRLK